MTLAKNETAFCVYVWVTTLLARFLGGTDGMKRRVMVTTTARGRGFTCLISCVTDLKFSCVRFSKRLQSFPFAGEYRNGVAYVRDEDGAASCRHHRAL